jgi:UDP:flavonoid glycosyltransferase YjiC (YdhE family)
MAHYLVAATALPGHVAPMLAIARHLVRLGHTVTVHTASVFREQAQRIGAAFVPLRAVIDYDWRDVDARFPERTHTTPGHARLCWGLKHLVADAIAPQLAGLRAIIDTQPVDAVLVDTMFCGAMPLALDARRPRPPIVGIGISALPLASCDTAFFGTALPPSSTTEGRVRNRLMHTNLSQAMFGDVQQYFDAALAALGAGVLPAFFVDAMVTLPDRYLQLTVPGFEYPRSDLPASVRYVGALLAPPTDRFEPPSWWSELDDGRALVVVTQGTLANGDPGELIAPTLAALADDPAIRVVATTGGTGVVAPQAPNIHVETFIPYDRLLPRASVVVTNGGYGSVNHALSLGVPLVVAGGSEEKPEIAARVAWSGAGLDLHTARPTPRQVGDAVRRVLATPVWRVRARELADEYARYDALENIENELIDLGVRRAPSPRPCSAALAS